MDVVYLVKRSRHNEELRFSLRSLTNLPHGNVWVAGHTHRWLTNVGHIPVDQNPGQKWASQARNLSAACKHPGVSETFVMFNDDFFVMKPTDRVPTLHGGPMEPLVKRGNMEWRRRFRETFEHCGPGALSYDGIHVPMVFDKARLADVLDDIGTRLLFRSVYGNRYRVGGSRVANAKVSGETEPPDSLFLSTSDRSFKHYPVGKHIRDRLPDPSPYEQ
jgi:hypothetical protein